MTRAHDVYLTISHAPCPRCKRQTLDLDVRPKMTSRQTQFNGMFAIAVEVEHLPVAYCTGSGCTFEQWGRIEGPFVVFDEHSR